jgi:hypothetical protein
MSTETPEYLDKLSTRQRDKLLEFIAQADQIAERRICCAAGGKN